MPQQLGRREAGSAGPHTRAYDLEHADGEVFKFKESASKLSVLWGEMFKESERHFLRKELEEQLISFTIRDSYQLMMRSTWQPDHTGSTGPRSDCVLLLHALDSRRSANGWTWAKLARPLHKRGFSVVMLEFPGFGTSTMNMDGNCEVEKWKSLDFKMVGDAVGKLRIQKFRTVSCEQSCATVIRFLQLAPHRLEKEHVFHNPELDLTELFPEAAALREGRVPSLRQQREIGIARLEELLRLAEFKLFCTFDEAASQKVKDTWAAFLEIKRRSQVLDANIIVQTVTREDVCESQIGVNVPMRFFFISNKLKQDYANFLEHGNVPDGASGIAGDESGTSSTPSQWSSCTQSERSMITAASEALPGIPAGAWTQPQAPQNMVKSSSTGQLRRNTSMNEARWMAAGTLGDDAAMTRRNILRKITVADHERTEEQLEMLESVSQGMPRRAAVSNSFASFFKFPKGTGMNHSLTERRSVWRSVVRASRRQSVADGG